MPRTKTRLTEQEVQEGGGSLAKQVVTSLKGDHLGVGLGSEALEADVTDYIDTQCPMLNYTMGIPGIPVGRLTVIFGKEGSAKSSLGHHLLAATQAKGGVAVIFDAERAIDRKRMTRIGVDMEDLIVCYPDCLEDIFGEIVGDAKDEEGKKAKVKGGREGKVGELIAASRAIGADIPITIIIDSLSAIKTRKEIEEGTHQPAMVARYMSAKMPIINALLARAHVCLVIINQLRVHMDINPNYARNPERRKVMGERWGMVAEQTLIYYASLMLNFSAIGSTGEKEDPTGIVVRVSIPKEKVGPGEGKRCEFEVLKDSGINSLGSGLDVLMDLGVIEQGGGWLTYQDGKGFRRSEWSSFISNHPELSTTISEAPTLWERGGPIRKVEAAED